MESDDAASARAAAGCVSNPRWRTYHDPGRLLGRAMARTLGWKYHVAWDTYFVYRPGKRWSGGPPPAPDQWFHQLQDREIWLRTGELELGDLSWTKQLAEQSEADPTHFRTGDDLRQALVEALIACGG